MPRLEELKIASIDERVVDSLVGREENQRLEFKETIDGVPGNEVAKDLLAMTNGSGGFLIIGAMEDPQTKRCSGFRSVNQPQSICTRLKDLALQYLKPPLTVAPETRKSSAGDNLVIAEIPGSKRPRAIEYNGRTELWKRYGTDKRQMSYAEIEKALTPIDPQQELEQQRRLAADRTRWNEITDRGVLWEVVDAEFKRVVAENRYLRLTITPNRLAENLVDVGDQNLQMFLWHPIGAGQREHGWNVQVGPWGAQLVSDSFGIRSQPLEKNGLKLPFISLSRSGHLEFWVPVEAKTFLPPMYWKTEIPDKFVLWPTAICEYPVSFLRFAKALYGKVGVVDDFVWRMEYRNLRGCILYPFVPGRGVTLEGPRAYNLAHFEPREAALEGDWDPDKSALVLIRKLYEAFGLSARHVPLFFEDRFEPDRWQC